MNTADQLSEEKKKPFDITLIKKGIFWFLTISIISMVSIFLYTNTGNTIEVWKGIELKYIAIAGLIMCMDLLIGGWRNHIFAREFNPGISQWVSFKANLGNIFMGSVTPSQSGGGLAQLYVYTKNGIKLGDAITISFINWISTLTFFPISGLIAYQIISDKVPKGFITYLAQFGFSLFTTLFTIVMIALFFPKVLEWIITQIALLLGKVNSKWKSKIESAGTKVKSTLIDYRKKCTKLLSSKPQLMLFSFLITVTLYFNKYLLGYIIVLALGVDVDFLTIIAIQAIVYLLLYFAPSPGGSGIAELSLAGLMSGILADDYIASFTVMQRGFLVFVPAILGAFVILKLIKSEIT
jgi:uncharacterized protein (TIRG00374 family)